MNLQLGFLAGVEAVNAFDDAFGRAFRHRRHRVVIVIERDVVEEIFLLLIHPPDAVLDDDRNLIRVSRIVRGERGNGARQQEAVAILMLQAFSAERGPARCTTHQKAFAARIRECPDQIAHALKSEHRIVNKERNHLDSVVHVGGPGRCRRRHRSGFRNAFFKDLAVLRFLVIKQHVRIVRLIKLALAGVYSNLPEQRLHAEGARLVGDDRHNALTEFWILQKLGQDSDERHGSRRMGRLRGLKSFGKGFERRSLNLRGRNHASGHVPAEHAPALMHVGHFRAMVGRPVERSFTRGLIGNRDLEAALEVLDGLVAHLLLLVSRIAAFPEIAKPITLHGLGQDHGWPAFVLDRGLVCVINLLGIVPAAAQLPDLFIAHVLDQLERFGIFPEKFLANVGAALGLKRLVLAIDALVHELDQRACLVARQQFVPIAAPHQLDHIPARAPEYGFELLDNLAVAAHRTIEPLQVAVHDKDQVIQLLAGTERDRAERFGFIRLAIAQKRPDFARSRLDQAPIFEIVHKPGLIDRVDGRQTHRHRGKLPKIRHQPRVRIGRKPRMVAQFMAEVAEVFLAETALKIRARIDAGRGMALEIDHVSRLFAIAGMEEMIETDLEQSGQRRVGGNVAADAMVVLVLMRYHGHRVPTGEALDTAFERAISWKRDLRFNRYRVDIRCVELNGNFHSRRAGALTELF